MQCNGCGNHCQLTVNIFADGKRFISGNRCDKPVTGKATNEDLDLYAYKLRLLLDYKPQNLENSRGTIGLPLCLNMYELLPFWHTLFTKLGFTVKTSPVSSRALYQEPGHHPQRYRLLPGQARARAHRELVKMGVDAIFYPCMSYNIDEHLGRQPLQLPGRRLLPRSARGQLPRACANHLHLRLSQPGPPQGLYQTFPGGAGQVFPRP